MKIIGLCGGSGSGKGAVGKIFSENGYFTIDTDKVYRDITDNTSRCLDALVCEFGGDILNSAGTLNRKALADIVFSDKVKLRRLNAITHKFVLERVRDIITELPPDKYVGAVVDAPLLYESGFDKECDYVIAVVADMELRVNRIISRDGIEREAAYKRINSQISDDHIGALADFVIDNNGDLSMLKDKVLEIIKKIN